MHMCPSCGVALARFEPMTWGNVSVTTASEIRLNGERVEMSATQRIVAEAIIRSKGRVVSYSTLLSVLDSDCDSMSIRTIVLRIRRAFARIDPSFDQLRSSRALGYHWQYSEQTTMLAA